MKKTTAAAIADYALCKGYVIDTHNGKKTKMNVDVVLIIEDKTCGQFSVAWASRTAPYFSVNPMYKEDGVVFISTVALGPVVDLRNATLEEEVARMNEFYAEPKVENGFEAYRIEIVERKTAFEKWVDEFNNSQDLYHINLVEA